LLSVQIIHNPAILQIPEFGAISQIVYNQDIIPANGIQAKHKITAYKSSTTGDNNH
jgi:hypothetical protein